MGSAMGAGAFGHGMRACRRLQGCSRGLTAATSRRGRRRASESRRFGPKRDGVSRAVCGRYACGIAGAARLSMRNGYGAAQHVRRKKEDG